MVLAPRVTETNQLKLNLRNLMPWLDHSMTVVEIGNDWIKFLRADTVARRRTISKIFFSKLSQIKEPVENMLSRVSKEFGLSRHGTVVMSLPRQLATLRILELPSENPAEIDEIIQLQVGKQTPCSKEEIVFSSRLIGRVKEGYTRVLLTIARRSLVKERLETLEKAGIPVDRVELSTEGVYDWFTGFCMSEEFLEKKRCIAVVDIDSNYTDFLVIENKQLVYTKNLLIGSNHLIDEWDSCRDKFAEELRRAMDLYHEESKGARIGRVYLTGSSKSVAGLGPVLTGPLGVSCDTVSTPEDYLGKDLRPFSQDQRFRYLSLTPLFGIIYRKNGENACNFLPAENKIERFMEIKRNQLTLTGILSIAVIGLFCLAGLVYFYQQGAYIRELRQKLNSIQNDVQTVEKMRLVSKLARERQTARGNMIQSVDELYRLIPNGVYLTEVDIERRKQILLKGRAQSMSDVFKFVSALEKSSCFTHVKNSYTSKKKENQNEFADFEIQGLIK